MALRETILNFASRQRTFRAADVLRALSRPVSRQYVSRMLTALVEEGLLAKAGSTRGAVYALPRYATALGTRVRRVKRRLTNVELQEDKVLDDLKRAAPFLTHVPGNVNAIFSYAFLEMLNNAIEHSGSKHIEVEVAKSNAHLTFIVNDFGIGVFLNVMRRRDLRSELEAIQDLLKGKTTTHPQAHSGEGIFFTSKVGDMFILESFHHRLRVDNRIEDYFIEDRRRPKKGTQVTFSLSEKTQRRLEDVFRRYTVDDSKRAFDKSEIKVKLFALGTGYVSRSEARRMLVGLDKFRSIVLDFHRVPTIGQAFADEVFRVFRLRRPDITIIPINMNETVKFMVDRAFETPSPAQGGG